MYFMGFLWKLKDQHFSPKCWPRIGLRVDQAGRPEPRAGRPGGSTDVHRTVHVWQFSGRVDRAGRPELRAVLSVLLGRPGGSTGGSNGRIFDRYGSTGRVDRQVWQTPTAIFFWPINLGVLSLFCNKILGELWASFPILLKGFSPHIWVQILPIKREDFI